jgi:hypothetical protein
MAAQRASLKKELRDIRTTVRELALSLGRMDAILSHVVGGNGHATARPTRRGRVLKLTPARRRALKLQGTYIGTIRTLKPALKAKVKQIRAEKGIRAAIAAARGMAGRT